MNKLITLLLIVFVIGSFALFASRFLLGGDEDTWICADNKWVRHGNPTSPIPQTGCGEVKDSWQEQTFNEAGLVLRLKIPLDMTFRKEIADNAGKIRVASFYVEKVDKNNPTYQLYAVYQPLETVNEQELERAKIGLDSTSIKETSIDGYKGIEGIANISDPKKHYQTTIIKDGKWFTVSTWPPTPENKALTNQILATFKFK
ncbi:MAG: hypothetical protein M1308_21825 [Actinobacteria bacterium]|nr:hypothetical protein [Actinomycetota bacterium]